MHLKAKVGLKRLRCITKQVEMKLTVMDQTKRVLNPRKFSYRTEINWYQWWEKYSMAYFSKWPAVDAEYTSSFCCTKTKKCWCDPLILNL